MKTPSSYRTTAALLAYNATTGAAISPSFITGLHLPSGLAVLDDHLFVANFESGTVGKYNATTGAAINANFITVPKLTLAVAVLRNTLFVATRDKGFSIGGLVSVDRVREYDATTGAAINANFITDLNDLGAIAVMQ